MLQTGGLQVDECYTTRDHAFKYTLIHLKQKKRISSINKFLDFAAREHGIVSQSIFGYESVSSQDGSKQMHDHPGIRILLDHMNNEHVSFSMWTESRHIHGGGVLVSYKKQVESERASASPFLLQQHIPSTDESGPTISTKSNENTGAQLDDIASNIKKIYDLIQDQSNPEHRKLLEQMFNSIKELEQESAIKDSLLQENKALKLQKQRWEQERDHNEYKRGLITREKNKEIKHLKEKLIQFSWAEQFIPTIFEMAKKMGIQVPEIQSGSRGNIHHTEHSYDSDGFELEESGNHSISSAGLDLFGTINTSEQAIDPVGVNIDEVGERVTGTMIRNHNESEYQLESMVILCLFK